MGIEKPQQFTIVGRKASGGEEHLGVVEGTSGLIQLLETIESSDVEIVKYEIFKENA